MTNFTLTRLDERQIENLSVSALEDYLVINRTAGVMFVNPVVSASGLTIYAPAITAAIYSSANFGGFPLIVSIPATSLQCVNNAPNYLTIDYNNGNPIYKIYNTVPSGAYSSIVPVNSMLAVNGYVHLSHWDTAADCLTDKIHKRLITTQRYVRSSGLELSVTNSVVKINAGIAWRGAREFELLDTYSDGTNDSLWFFYHTTATSGWTTVVPASGTNYNQYDTKAGLATLSNNFYTINWIYRGIEDHQHGYYILGDKEYKDLPTALAERAVPALPQDLSYHGMLVGRIIFKKGISTPAAIESLFDAQFAGSTINEHNDLGGIQGGIHDTEFYHLSAAQHANLTGPYPTFDGIKLNNAPTATTWQPGIINYDPDSGTAQVTREISGVYVQIGEELQSPKVFNQTGSTILNGKIVYVSGSNGNKPLVALASAVDEIRSSKVLGVMTTDVLNGGNNFGYATTQGLVHDLNTAGLSGGTLLWLSSTPGEWTTVRPVAPLHAVYIGMVIKEHGTDGIVYVNPVNGFEMNELHDVLITGIQDQDILVWNATSGVFQNSNYITLNNAATSGKQPYHGFVNRTSTNLLFNNSTLTFTLSGSNYDIYFGGVLYNGTISKSITVSASPEWGNGVTDPLGQWFIWSYANGNLGCSKSPWDILATDVTPVATLYIQNSPASGFHGIIAEERHGHRRNLVWHNHAHYNYGASYTSGYSTTPTFNANNTFSFPGGVISDEDIVHDKSSTQTTASVGYSKLTTSGPTTVRTTFFDPVSTGFVKINGANGRVYYDNAGVLTELTSNNQYTVYWVYATNRENSIVSIMGQGVYGSTTEADSAPYPTLYGLSVAEWRLLYRVVVRGANAAFSISSVAALYNQSIGPVIQAATPAAIPASNVSTLVTGSLTGANAQVFFNQLVIGDIRYNRAGTLSVITGSQRYYPLRSCSLIDVLVACNTAPSGASLLMNVLKNGVSVKTVTLTSGSNTVLDTFSAVSLLDTDYLTIDITQVGSVVAGSDLSVRIRYS